MTIKSTISQWLFRLFPRKMQRMQILRRPWQLEMEFFLISAFCARRETAIDVGGNIGIYAYEMSRHAGMVVIFEPN